MTAARGKQLTSLDHTIREGNSVISEPAEWNQPRKGTSDAKSESRSRSENSVNAETPRFAEGRREGRKKRLFSSAFLRALCVSALILLSL